MEWRKVWRGKVEEWSKRRNGRSGEWMGWWRNFKGQPVCVHHFYLNW